MPVHGERRQLENEKGGDEENSQECRRQTGSEVQDNAYCGQNERETCEVGPSRGDWHRRDRGQATGEATIQEVLQAEQHHGGCEKESASVEESVHNTIIFPAMIET
jgi:hypothetical protein